MSAFDEIKKLYYAATKATIQQDIERAIDLLKTLPIEEERERVAVYMDGLSQMRSEWSDSARGNAGELRRDKKRAPGGGVGASRSGSPPPASGRPRGGPQARSGRSRASSRPTR